MGSRKQRLEELGYEEPFDESPVDIPEGWKGGDVRNTGGGTMCRVWRNFDAESGKEQPALEVIYNVVQSGRVGLQEYKWNGEYYIHNGTVDSTVVDNEDHNQAEIARLYMRKYKMFI